MRLVRYGGAMSLDGYTSGIPLLPPPAERAALKLRKQRLYEKTGTIGLEYDIVRSR
jgi:hypothetical protein